MAATQNYADLGFLRTAAVAPEVHLADPLANADGMIECLSDLKRDGVAIALFPELALTGYSSEDLFFTSKLQSDVKIALASMARASTDIITLVGTPWYLPDGRLLNCAAILANGSVAGLVPKSALPNYAEFYDRRWFTGGADIDIHVDGPFGAFRIGPNQLFQIGEHHFAVEICEDLWAPEPPGAKHSLAGAALVFNLSASNELVAKADYRRDLVRMASAQWLCGYLYASSGLQESTKDIVFGGHLIAAENGQVIGEGERFQLGVNVLIAEFDLDKLCHDRMQNTTFSNAPRNVDHHLRTLAPELPKIDNLTRRFAKHPFVPQDEKEFDARAQEILNIQANGLGRRLLSTNVERLVLGLSGGVDSTLAFLVCLDALRNLGLSNDHLHTLTMPGPGTTDHTKTTAHQLANAANVPLKEISISAAVAQHLKDLEHTAEDDVVFENAQARERTQILFDYANKVGGIVVGTGDLSELALGWCTFNADHMANYNVNASVPKTLVAYLVRWYAQHRATDKLAPVLERVLDTPITPELIAPTEGKISQETEAIIGPYELHDFFLFHYARNGFSPAKIYRLAHDAFAHVYDDETLKRWLKVFFSRFFSQQFKRTTLPPGPKVGTVSLSPRGDWRMPDEASAERIVAEIDDY
ncbi:MAG: NAD(+) synthase [Gammaproteobacteria bacterium]|nr:NAD(+) synthase [Gammaproteobacteria bacterium]